MVGIALELVVALYVLVSVVAVTVMARAVMVKFAGMKVMV